jgi:tetratricopeptide (TPR) repeat protein
MGVIKTMSRGYLNLKKTNRNYQHLLYFSSTAARKLLKVLWLFSSYIAGFVFFSWATSSLSSEYIKKEEWAFLPKWCQYTMDGPHSGTKQSKALFSQLGIPEDKPVPLHHYCRALVSIFRSHAIGIKQTEREFHLQQAVHEIDFTFEWLPPNFSLSSEMLTKKGHALLMLNKYKQAEESLHEAIKQQPKYWPPYGYLSDVYLQQKQTEKAKAILRNGLKVAPDAKGLRNRLAKIEKSESP